MLCLRKAQVEGVIRVSDVALDLRCTKPRDTNGQFCLIIVGEVSFVHDVLFKECGLLASIRKFYGSVGWKSSEGHEDLVDVATECL